MFLNVILDKVITSTPIERAKKKKTVTVQEPEPEFNVSTLSQVSDRKGERPASEVRATSEEGATSEVRATSQGRATSKVHATTEVPATITRDEEQEAGTSHENIELRIKVPRYTCKFSYEHVLVKDN